jgi:hypothetical protein
MAWNIAYKPVVASGGGGGASAIQTKLDQISAGVWTRWDEGDIDASLSNPNGSGSDPVTSNASKFNWDSVNNKIVFYGHGHTGDQSLTLTFDDATGVWSNTDPPAYASAPGDDAHQFGGQTGDLNGNIYFHKWYDDPCKMRPNNTTNWTTLADSGEGFHAQLNGAAFNPTVSTQGVAVFGSSYGINQYNPATDSWSNRWAGFGAGGLRVSDFSNGFYDVASASTYFCGGNTQSGSLVQVPAVGTVVQKNDMPINVYYFISLDNPVTYGMMVDGYTVPSNGTIRKPVLVGPAQDMWEYNSGSDTWTALGKTVPISGITNNGSFVGCVPPKDCLILFLQNTTLGGCAAWIYKRP